MCILKYSNIAMVHSQMFSNIFKLSSQKASLSLLWVDFAVWKKNRIPLPESAQIAQVNSIAHPSNVLGAPHPSNVLVCQMAGVRRGSLGLSSEGTEGEGSKLEQGVRRPQDFSSNI